MIRSTVVAWIGILALVIQLAAAPSHVAMAGPAEADAVAALSALLGQKVALCDHGDASGDSGSPSRDSGHCRDDCPLCQFTGHSVGLVPPDHAGPAIFARYAEPLSVPEDSSLAKPQPVAFAQPRAPPISA
jgi:hypothetical protein